MGPNRFKVEYLVLAFFVACAALLVVSISGTGGLVNASGAMTVAPSPPQDGRQLVGAAVCTDCHTLAAENFAHTIHAQAFTRGVMSQAEDLDCEACHGPGSAHAEDPSDIFSIIRFSGTSRDPIQVQNGQCLNCHTGGERIHWMASIHERADVGCSDCHNPMGNVSSLGLLAQANVNETCFGCHQEQRVDFRRRSHMPLFEGKVGCLDCHNPHGTAFDTLLRTANVNETCFGCHAEKRGPFLFEHAPVTEDCLNCHLPHGSNHERLLVAARPILCQGCHTMTGHMNDLLTRGFLASGNFPDPRVVGRSCQNCHSQIHGSNHPAGSKFHR